MVTPLPVLIDLNVILDAIGRREPFYEGSARVLAAAEVGLITGYVAAHSLTTLYYLLAKHRSRVMAQAQLADLVRLVSIAAVDARVIEQALALPYSDFEDAVQMMAGVHAGAEYIVTRDLAGFKSGPLPTLSPAELFTLLRTKDQ